MAKKIVIGLLIILMLAGAVGALGYFTQGFKDWTFKPGEGDKVTEQSKLLKEFAEVCEWSFAIGEGDKLFTMSSDTEVMYLDNLDNVGNGYKFKIEGNASLPTKDLKGLALTANYDAVTYLSFRFYFSNALSGITHNQGTFSFMPSEDGTMDIHLSGDADGIAHVTDNPLTYFAKTDELDKVKQLMAESDDKTLGHFEVQLHFDKRNSDSDMSKGRPLSGNISYSIPVILK